MLSDQVELPSSSSTRVGGDKGGLVDTPWSPIQLIVLQVLGVSDVAREAQVAGGLFHSRG